MLSVNTFKQRFQTRDTGARYRSIWQYIHLDIPLLFTLVLLMTLGLFILYSTSNQDWYVIHQQLFRIGFAFIVMFVFAQIPPSTYQRWALFIYLSGLGMLVAVMIMGHIGNG